MKVPTSILLVVLYTVLIYSDNIVTTVRYTTVRKKSNRDSRRVEMRI